MIGKVVVKWFAITWYWRLLPLIILTMDQDHLRAFINVTQAHQSIELAQRANNIDFSLSILRLRCILVSFRQFPFIQEHTITAIDVPLPELFWRT
jgi:hypothetical protein